MKNYLSLFLCPAMAFSATLAAYQFANVPPDYRMCLAAFLATWAVYTLDRLKGSAEDAINNPERGNVFIGHEKLYLATIAGAFLGAVAITAFIDAWKLYAVLNPTIAGLLYTSKIGSHRLKDIPFAKTILVAVSWGASASGIAGFNWSIFLFISMNLVINTIVCDIRDIEGDRLHGVRTIPVLLGRENTRLALTVLASCMWFVLPVGLLSTITVLFGYAMIFLPFREWFVDGDWTIIMGIYMVLSQIMHY